MRIKLKCFGLQTSPLKGLITCSVIRKTKLPIFISVLEEMEKKRISSILNSILNSPISYYKIFLEIGIFHNIAICIYVWNSISREYYIHNIDVYMHGIVIKKKILTKNK